MGKIAKTQSKMAVAVMNKYETDKYNSLFARDSHRASWQQQGLLVWDDCKKINNQEFKRKKNKGYRILFSLCMLLYKLNTFNAAQI